MKGSGVRVPASAEVICRGFVSARGTPRVYRDLMLRFASSVVLGSLPWWGFLVHGLSGRCLWAVEVNEPRTCVGVPVTSSDAFARLVNVRRP